MQARTKEKQELCTCRRQQTLMSMALSTPFDLLWSMLKLMSTFTSVSASVSFTIGTCIKISNGFYPSLPFSFYQSPCSNLHAYVISNGFYPSLSFSFYQSLSFNWHEYDSQQQNSSSHKVTCNSHYEQKCLLFSTGLWLSHLRSFYIKSGKPATEGGTHRSFVEHFDLVEINNLLLHQSVIQRPQG